MKTTIKIVLTIVFAYFSSYLIVLSIPYGALCTICVFLLVLLCAVLWIFRREFMYKEAIDQDLSTE